ncbi:MAG: prolipoprotein diacylglyceryl transferase [Myxococcota bacterium]
MSEPLIPAIEVPELPILPGEHSFEILGRAVEIGPWTIKPFGALVAVGVYLGVLIAARIARKRGIHPEAMSKFMYWVLASAFVFGHVLDAIFYHPQRVMADPLLLLRLWDGLSSFGGFIGAAIGVFAFKYRYKVKRVLPFADTMAAAFPVGWTFGRMGCAVVHDHPGMRSDLWFAVAFEHGGRFDLGLYEMVFALIVAIVCLILARKPKPPGFFLGFTMLVYAPVRFALDFLRAEPGHITGADPRYLMLTPAQWASFAMVAAGFALLWHASGSDDVGNEPFEAAANDADPSLLQRSNEERSAEAA